MRMKSLLKEKILRSGIIFTALSFITAIGNVFFQRIAAGALTASGEFGAAKNTTVFVGLLGLPLLIANTAIIHHIAHFRGAGNEARLQGLLAGCRSFQRGGGGHSLIPAENQTVMPSAV